MPQHFKPRSYGNAATQFLLQHDRCALFMDMGLGKTIAVLNAIEVLANCGEDDPVLIVAPIHVARATWSNEIEKWHHTSHLTLAAIVGSPSERLKALKSDAQIKTINYENIEWLVDTLDGKWPFKTVIFDESSKLKSFRAHVAVNKHGTSYLRCTSGKRASAIIRPITKHTKRVWLLTGTPCLNSLTNLWAQLFFIDQGKRLGNNYTAFQERWFKVGFNGFTIEPLPHAEEEIRERIRDVVFTLQAKDYLELGDEVTNTILVELPPKARKHYEEMEAEFFTTIRSGTVEAFGLGSRSAKCHQIANGAVYYDRELSYEVIHDAKIEALSSIVEEASGQPVLVAYKFKSDLARLKKAFPEGVEFSPKIDKTFNSPLLFIHPDSAGHGIDFLQYVTNTIVFFSLDWNAETRLQVIARIGAVRQFQAGFKRPVIIHQIVARNTVDEMIVDRIENKVSVEQAMKNMLAKRNFT